MHASNKLLSVRMVEGEAKKCDAALLNLLLLGSLIVLRSWTSQIRTQRQGDLSHSYCGCAREIPWQSESYNNLFSLFANSPDGCKGRRKTVWN